MYVVHVYDVVLLQRGEQQQQCGSLLWSFTLWNRKKKRRRNPVSFLLYSRRRRIIPYITTCACVVFSRVYQPSVDIRSGKG